MKTRTRILRALHVLHLSDLETMYGLLASEKVQADGLRQHLYRLLDQGLVRRIYLPDDPLNPYRSLRKRAVFMLGTKAYDELGIAKKEAKQIDQRYSSLAAHGSRLPHELMLTIIHACLLKAQEVGRGVLTDWLQGEGAGTGLRIKPDARFQWNGQPFYLEAQNKKRLITNSQDNRSTEKQVNRYSRLDLDSQLDPGVRVLFVTREAVDPRYHGVANLLELFKSQGYLRKHHKRFFQVTSLTLFKDALKDPQKIYAPLIQTALGETLSLPLPRATGEEPGAARHVSSSSEDRSNARAS